MNIHVCFQTIPLHWIDTAKWILVTVVTSLISVTVTAKVLHHHLLSHKTTAEETGGQ